MTEINPTPATVVNLREAKRELASAKKPAPAKKVPAKPAPKKQAGGKTPAAKITWTRSGEADAKGQAPGTGTCGDRTYQIDGKGDSWKATVAIGNGKPTVLADNVSGKTAWQECVAHNRSAS